MSVVSSRNTASIYCYLCASILFPRLLADADAEAAVPSFQNVLRGDAADAAAWEGLASAYQALGRFTAALKVETVAFAGLWTCSRSAGCRRVRLIRMPPPVIGHCATVCAGAQQRRFCWLLAGCSVSDVMASGDLSSPKKMSIPH